ncbi:MAG: peptide chain release factor N(5)-glutamine methyltransferase [Pseudomonadota bacterium]|jgi:release factor glutamine methyltransferase
MVSIQNILDSATNLLLTISDSPRLDAEVLLAFILEKNRSYLRAWNDKNLDETLILKFETLLSQRLKGVPIAYLTGKREFWSRDFYVSTEVLIPRPDTEILIEHCLAQIPIDLPFKILDLGTGSGAIAVTLAAERSNTQIIAVDKSAAALEIAKKNANQHDCENIAFILSDWFSCVPKMEFDLIVSNPPYIPFNDKHLTQGDVRFEPKSALISAENGLSDIKKIATEAQNYLKQNGQLWFEHGYNQAESVQEILMHLDYSSVQTFADLAGQSRVTRGIF